MQSAEKPANTRLDPRCLELQPPREPGELRQIVREASRALAFLDVVRLESEALFANFPQHSFDLRRVFSTL